MNHNNLQSLDTIKKMPAQEINSRIQKAKSILGESLLILGHHYEMDEVIAFCDEVGDSFGLAKTAAKTSAEYIVFCGVHFMAETTDVITSDEQKVFLPDLSAGCFLADCAKIEQVEKAWKEITEISKSIIPITYINSDMRLKDFCGRNGGIVCTSANAQMALEWAWQRGEKVFFFPDQHLGRNTAFRMGIPLDKIVMWNFEKESGSHSVERIEDAKLILWNGFCDVHQEFSADYTEKLRTTYPEIKILAHPECNFDICKNADIIGSTSVIIKTVENAEKGSIWGIGTEKKLVERLQKRLPDKKLLFLLDHGPECKTMSQINLVNLLFQLENIVAGNFINRVCIDNKIGDNALIAINRMLEL